MRLLPLVSLTGSLVLGIAPLSLSAQHLHGCVQKRVGSLRIVSSPDECNPQREMHVSWNVLGPQGPEGKEGPAGLPGPVGSQIHLFDADDKDLGAFDFTDSQFGRGLLYVGVGWIDVSLRTSFVGIDSVVFFPESTDCSGPAYWNEGFAIPGFVIPTHERFFLFSSTQRTAVAESQGSVSHWRDTEQNPPCEPSVVHEGFYFPLNEITESVDLQLPLKGPLSVRPVP
jgi:hypothetical protein